MDRTNLRTGAPTLRRVVGASGQGRRAAVGPAVRKGTVATLVVAFAAWLLTNIDQSLFGYAIPDLRTTFGVDLQQISLVISASFMAGVVLPVAIGVLSDRWGARWTLPLCLCGSALCVGLQGLAPGFGLFALLRIISFGLSASLSPITNAIVAASAPPRWREMAIAGLQCAYPLGWFLASLIVAPLIEQVGWRVLFGAGFVVAAIAAPLGRFLPSRAAMAPNPAVEAAKPVRPLTVMLSPAYRRTTVLCGFAFFLNSGAVAATVFFLPSFLHEVRGYDVPAASLIVGAAYGVSVIGYIGSTYVSMRWLRRRDTIILWNVAAAALFAMMVWLPHSVAEDLVAFGITSIFFYGVSAIMITFVLESFPLPLRTTAAAVCGTACVSLSMVVFPVVTAKLVASIGWQASFTAIVCPALLLCATTMMFLPRGAMPCRVVDPEVARMTGRVSHVRTAKGG